jgi:hypothetical protein
MLMKTPITVRVDPVLLAATRRRARQENRTLTNFIETVLKDRLGPAPSDSDSTAEPMADRHDGPSSRT